MKKKREHNYGLLVLAFLLVSAVIFFINYEKQLNKPVKKEELKEKVTHTDEEIKSLYDSVNLTYSEDQVMTSNDLKSLESVLQVKDFSNQLRIIYGLKNQPKKNFGTEGNYTGNNAVVDKDGYKYSGKYIKASFVKDRLQHVLGPITYTDQSITLPTIKYVYSKNMDIYRLFVKEIKDIPQKVTYIESSYDDNNIYITEYMAYTRVIDGFKTSYTRHTKLLPIGITNKNITENLDLIDRYQYKFTYNKDVKKYFLASITYLK